jgi:hypothetical protein
MTNPTIKELIEFGFFPKELPPPFSVITFVNAIPNIKAEKIFAIINKKITESDCVQYSIPRPNRFRRDLSVPNPFFQLKLGYSICNNWGDIERHLTSNISISTISFPRTEPLFNNDIWEKRYDFFIKNSASNRFVLISDISRFYSTIYTHTIGTAMHGELIGSERDDLSKIGVLLDKEVRSCRMKKTHGIPVGPMTSFILHEIIACSVDKEFESLLIRDKIPLNGVRYIDDFELFFISKSDAEKALSKLEIALKNFELEINHEKTKILELPIPIESEWVSTLRSFQIRKDDEPIGQKHDIINYFSRVFALSRKFLGDNVIKYSIHRFLDLDQVLVHKNNWEIFESLILNLILVDKTSLDLIVDLLFEYKKKEYTINTDLIKSNLTTLIVSSLPDQHFEISWALWMAKVFSISFTEEVGRSLSENLNPIIAIIAFDLSNQGLLPQYQYPDTAIFQKSENLYSDKWILVYETIKNDWIKGKIEVVLKDPLFIDLFNQGVSFYDKSKIVPNPRKKSDLSKKY